MKTNDQEEVLAKLDRLLELLEETSRRWLSIPQAADRASLCQMSIRRMVQTGKLTAHRPVKGRVLIDATELDNVIESSTITPKKGRGRRA